MSKLKEIDLKSISAFGDFLAYLVPCRHYSSAYKSYVSRFYYCYERHGNSALVYFKGLHSVASKIVLRQYTYGSLLAYFASKKRRMRTFMYTDGIRYPIKLKPLLPLLLSDSPRLNRIGLTITTVYRLIPTKVKEKDYEDYRSETSITSPSISKSVLNKFKKVARLLFYYLRPIIHKEDYIPFSDRSGINGPPLHRLPDQANRMLDELDSKGNSLLNAYETLNRFLYETAGFWDPLVMMDAMFPGETPPMEGLSRCTIIPDKGGKVRKVAMVDFFSSQLLYVLHTSLMKALKKLKSDASEDHNLGFMRALMWSKTQHVYTSDLSEFTTTIPRELVTIIVREWVQMVTFNQHPEISEREQYIKDNLRKVLPEELETAVVNSVMSLLANRVFHNKGRDPIIYQRGTPMGVYGSWPLSVMVHHVLILMSMSPTSSEVDITTLMNDYVLIGDDVAMKSSFAFDRYCELVQELGLKLSSHKLSRPLSKSSPRAFVFASRLGCNGTNLTPGSLLDLLQTYENKFDISNLIHKAKPSLFNRLFKYFSNRNFDLRATNYRKVLLTLPPFMGGKGLTGNEYRKYRKYLATPFSLYHLIKRHIKRLEVSVRLGLSYTEEPPDKKAPCVTETVDVTLDDTLSALLQFAESEGLEGDILEQLIGNTKSRYEEQSAATVSTGWKNLEQFRVRKLHEFVVSRIGIEVSRLSSLVLSQLREALRCEKDFVIEDSFVSPITNEEISRYIIGTIDLKPGSLAQIDVEALKSVIPAMRKLRMFQNKRDRYSKTVYDVIKAIVSKIALQPAYDIQDFEHHPRYKIFVSTLELIRDLYNKGTRQVNTLMYSYW